MTPPKKFDFETYAVQQFESIAAKLDSMNTTFVPRTETLLMLKERDDKIAAVKDDLMAMVNEKKARSVAIQSAVVGAVVLSLCSLGLALLRIKQ